VQIERLLDKSNNLAWSVSSYCLGVGVAGRQTKSSMGLGGEEQRTGRRQAGNDPGFRPCARAENCPMAHIGGSSLH
jgi:hypothetical protein